MKLANCATHRRPLAAGSRRPACHARLHPPCAFRADDSNNPNFSSPESPSKASSHSAGLDSDSSTPPWRQSGHLAQASSNKRSSPLDAGHTQPLWKKPCFPGVAMITFVTLPFDLAYTQYPSGHSTKTAHNPAGSVTCSRTASKPRTSRFGNTGFGSSSSSSTGAGSPPRHAKPTAQSVSTTPASALASDIGAVAQQASAAAATASGKDTFRQQQEQQTAQHGTSHSGAAGAGANAGRLAAEVANAAHAAESAAAAAQAAASRSSHAAQSASTKRSHTAPAKADAAAAAANAAFKRQPTGTTASVPPSWGAAAGVTEPSAAAAAAGRPVDSWDAGDAGVFSDEEAEQKAKAMVIELLTHPKDTEEALMRAAESGPGGADGSAGRPLSVSPDYIDALVQAVREPTVGMPHHQASTGNDVAGLGSPGSSGSSGPGPSDSNAGNSPAADAQADPPASPATAAAAAAVTSAQHPGKRAGSPSLWSWMEASPHSSQDEF